MLSSLQITVSALVKELVLAPPVREKLATIIKTFLKKSKYDLMTYQVYWAKEKEGSISSHMEDILRDTEAWSDGIKAH